MSKYPPCPALWQPTHARTSDRPNPPHLSRSPARQAPAAVSRDELHAICGKFRHHINQRGAVLGLSCLVPSGCAVADR